MYTIIALIVVLVYALTYLKRRVLRIHDSRVFMDEKGEVVPHTSVEREEQINIYERIEKGDKVLELGARYGTVSAILLDMVSQESDVVIVEPDAVVIDVLEKNLKENGFRNPNIFHGTVGFSKQKMSDGDGYAIQTVECEGDDCGIESVHYRDLEKKYGIVFDTIVADCEGCLPMTIKHILEFYPLLEPIRKIMFETDYEDSADYQTMYDTLTNLGFIRTKKGFIQVWERFQ